MLKPQGGRTQCVGESPFTATRSKGFDGDGSLSPPTFAFWPRSIPSFVERGKKKKKNFTSKIHIPRNILSNVTLPLPIRVIRNVTLACMGITFPILTYNVISIFTLLCPTGHLQKYVLGKQMHWDIFVLTELIAAQPKVLS